MALSDLPKLENRDNSIFDGWGREIGYKVEGTKVTLSSLGADGKPGGSGENKDIFYIFDVSKERDPASSSNARDGVAK